MKRNELSREELFALVWERPTTQVAQELGISDVALGKLCRRLQVPKPPRGYWARIASGKRKRKPPLPAYRAEIEKRLRKEVRSTSLVRLSKLQKEFLSYALEELSDTDADTNQIEMSYDGIRSVSPVLAAQILIFLQSRYEKWLSDRTTANSINGALRSLSNLVEKLQPHAKEQLLVFHGKTDDRHSRSYGPTISVRATHDFLARVAHLSQLARDYGLAYVSADMSALEHAWSVRHIYSPRSYNSTKSELCISANELWIRAELQSHWFLEKFETTRVKMRDICPIDLMPVNEQRLPAQIRRSSIKPYAERLQELGEAQVLYEDMIKSVYDMDGAIPDEKLALFDRLWFSRSDTGPFIGARKAWRKVESELERWEAELESESVALCQEVLGIQIGDIVLVDVGGKQLRIAVEGMMVITSDPSVIFSIWGKRFRKDGLPGKRNEQFSIAVENDL